MPHLQFRSSRYPLATGDNRVGWVSDADIRLPDVPGSQGATVAVIAVEDGSAAVRRLSEDGDVTVNGVHIAAEPTPVLHGDRLGVGGCELVFADESQLGETQEIPVPSELPTASPSGTVRESRSQGRLVSLVDGREYAVPVTGLQIGRDVSCDVVLSAPSVSRRHALISPTPLGYRLVDSSRNGVFVNGAKVVHELALGRADIVRIGSEEFRFYAEPEARESLGLDAVPGLQKTAAVPALQRPSPLGVPVIEAPAETSRPVLAHLEVSNEGPTRGQRYAVVSPLVHIGRASHNDVVIADESVSETHAKLQRRDDVWFLMDLDSTNGTYAAGQRLTADHQLTAGSEFRVGGVKLVFLPLVSEASAAGSTRVIAGIRAPDPKRVGQRTPSYTAVQDDREPSVFSRPFLLIVAAVLGGALYFLVRGGLR